MNLLDVLPVLVPKAVSWATTQETFIRADGQSLNAQMLNVARKVGVMHPESIRIAEVRALPMPTDPLLRNAATQTGLLGPGMIGLTLGYAVFVLVGHSEDVRLLSHEFRHVHQYEQAGGIEGFLPLYLDQVVRLGYHNAPFEIDARAHELHHI